MSFEYVNIPVVKPEKALATAVANSYVSGAPLCSIRRVVEDADLIVLLCRDFEDYIEVCDKSARQNAPIYLNCQRGYLKGWYAFKREVNACRTNLHMSEEEAYLRIAHEYADCLWN